MTAGPTSSSSMYQDLLSASLAGTVAKLALHPVDTVRTRLQIAERVTARDLLKRTRIRSLYRGMSPVMLLSAPGSAVYLTTYDTVRASTLAEQGSLGATLFAAVSAELVSGVVFTPMDILKQKMQASKSANPASMLKLMKRVWKSDGLQGFLRGYSISLASFVPYTVIYWETYEHLKASYTGSNSATPDLTFSLPASGFAAAVAAFATNPLDLVRTRLQVSGVSSAMETLAKVVRTNGLPYLFRGAQARVAALAPATAISIPMYEYLKGLFRSP